MCSPDHSYLVLPVFFNFIWMKSCITFFTQHVVRFICVPACSSSSFSFIVVYLSLIFFFSFQYDSVILNGIFNIRRQGADWYLSVLLSYSRVTLKPFTYNSSIIIIKAVVQAFFGVCDHPDMASKICAHVCFSREGKNFDRLLKNCHPKTFNN